MTKHIEILRSVAGFEVRVINDKRVLRRFTYPTIKGARKSAAAWTVPYENCEVRDLTGEKTDPDAENPQE